MSRRRTSSAGDAAGVPRRAVLNSAAGPTARAGVEPTIGAVIPTPGMGFNAPTRKRKPRSSAARGAVIRPARRGLFTAAEPTIGAVMPRQAPGGVMLALGRVGACGRVRRARRWIAFRRDRRTGLGLASGLMRLTGILVIAHRIISHRGVSSIGTTAFFEFEGGGRTYV